MALKAEGTLKDNKDKQLSDSEQSSANKRAMLAQGNEASYISQESSMMVNTAKFNIFPTNPKTTYN